MEKYLMPSYMVLETTGLEKCMTSFLQKGRNIVESNCQHVNKLNFCKASRCYHNSVSYNVCGEKGSWSLWRVSLWIPGVSCFERMNNKATVEPREAALQISCLHLMSEWPFVSKLMKNKTGVCFRSHCASI